MPGPQPWLEGSWELAALWSRPCGKRMWNFSLRWAALRELLCLFRGADKSPEKVP